MQSHITRGAKAALAAILALCVALPVYAADNVEVVIVGVDGRLADNLRAFLSLGNDNGRTLSERKVRRRVAASSAKIKAALEPYGYYQPDIRSEVSCDADECTVRYRIDKGRPTIIDKLVLKVTGEGRDHPAVQAALQASTLEEGQRLIHSRYKATKKALLQAAYNAGFLDAKYTKSQIRVWPERASAHIFLILDTGPRYYFGEVTIKQHILAPELVQDYVNFERGDVFNTALLSEVQLRLSSTDYFSQIEIVTDRDNIVSASESDNKPLPRLPVLIRTTPQESQKYMLSIGYGTDTGPRLGAGVVFRRLNRQGHQFRADIRLSAVEKALNARYMIPIDDVATDKLVFSTVVKQEEFGDGVSLIYRVGAARVDIWNWGRARLYFQLQRERFGFGSGKRTTRLTYFGLSLSYQSVSNALFVQNGFSVSTDIHGGFDGVFSTVGFLRATLQSTFVYSLTRDIRFLVRGKIGATQTAQFEELPPSQRFFTGGARSVRGYAYNEISPENAQGEDIGGQYLAQGSVELGYLFYKDFGAAVFFDIGDAPASIEAYDPKRAIGIGFRWLSPVGMVRLDFAHPLDATSPDIRFHFSVGPVF